MITLTKRQRFILSRMCYGGEDLAADGLSVWCGDERTSRATLNFFVRHCLISQDGPESLYYHINESGKLLLEGRQDIYRMSDGRYVEDWQTEMIKEHAKTRDAK